MNTDIPQLCNTNTADRRVARSKNSSRTWLLTIHTQIPHFLEVLKNYPCDEVAYQTEVAPTTDKLHIQAAIRFKNARDFELMKRDFPGAHLVRAKWPRAAMNYCQKDNTFNGTRYWRRLGAVLVDVDNAPSSLPPPVRLTDDQGLERIKNMIVLENAIRLHKSAWGYESNHRCDHCTYLYEQYKAFRDNPERVYITKKI